MKGPPEGRCSRWTSCVVLISVPLLSHPVTRGQVSLFIPVWCVLSVELLAAVGPSHSSVNAERVQCFFFEQQQRGIT